MIKKLRLKFKEIKKEGYLKYLMKNKYSVVIAIVFLFQIFFAVYNLNIKTPFGYDQGG